MKLNLVSSPPFLLPLQPLPEGFTQNIKEKQGAIQTVLLEKMCSSEAGRRRRSPGLVMLVVAGPQTGCACFGQRLRRPASDETHVSQLWLNRSLFRLDVPSNPPLEVAGVGEKGGSRLGVSLGAVIANSLGWSD